MQTYISHGGMFRNHEEFNRAEDHNIDAENHIIKADKNFINDFTVRYPDAVQTVWLRIPTSS